MRILLTIISVAAALVMISVSAALNYSFLASFGRTPFESTVFGSAGLAADVIKACLPWFAVLAWRSRRFVFVAAATAMFTLLSIASLAAAVGFSAELRGHSSQQRQQLSAALTDAQRKKATLQAQLAANGMHRTAEVIEAEIAGLKQNRSWTSSKQCSDVTLPRSRELCLKYHGTVAELRAAEAGRRLHHQLERLSARIHKVQGQGAGAANEPQVIFLAGLFDQEAGSVRLALILMTALVIEFGSGLGLYLAMHHSNDPTYEDKPGQGCLGLNRSKRGAALERCLPPTMVGNFTADEPEVLVERFCCARVYLARNATITVEALFKEFRDWAVAEANSHPSEAAFSESVERLMTDIGLRVVRGRITGIAVEPHEGE